MRAYAFFVVFSLILIWGTPDARAHGTAWKLLEDTDLRVVAFHYSDGEPMAYAEVMVFSPENSEVEHQNGRTDKHGKFAFCPDMSGAWRIIANDGMGHRCEAIVEMGAEDSSRKAEGARSETNAAERMEGSKTLKIVAGLSLISNFAFAAHFLRQRSRAGKRRS